MQNEIISKKVSRMTWDGAWYEIYVNGVKIPHKYKAFDNNHAIRIYNQLKAI